MQIPQPLKLTLLIAAGSLATMRLAANAEETKPAVREAPAAPAVVVHDCEFAPQLEKEALLPGEPVRLVIRLHNTSNEAVLFRGMASPMGHFPLTVADASGQSVPLTRLGAGFKRILGMGSARPVYVGPGKVVEYPVIINALYDTSFHGKYTVVVKGAAYRESGVGGMVRVQSQPLEFTIIGYDPQNTPSLAPTIYDRRGRLRRVPQP